MKKLVSSLTVFGVALLLLLAVGAQAELKRTKAPEGARVYFILPQDGLMFESPVTVRMGLSGLEVAPAGSDRPDTGHHHLLINLDLAALDLSQPLPFTDQTLHFGAGQTEATVDLKPGTHTMQLLFMDYRHLSFDPPLVSEKITITVK